MFRALTALMILLILESDSFGQKVQSEPFLKNGRLTAAEQSAGKKNQPDSLAIQLILERNIIWLSRLDDIADPRQKALLAEHGIRLEQWISGNSWLAVCETGFTLTNPRTAGIKNMYSIPPALKIDHRLSDPGQLQKTSKDLIVVSCFPADGALIEKNLRETGAQIVDTKIKSANTWFVRAGAESIRKNVPASLCKFNQSDSPGGCSFKL